MIRLEKSDPYSAESRLLREQLSAELAAITGSSGASRAATDSFAERGSLWVLARNAKGEAVGCGALRPLTDQTAEIKRMFSDRSVPGTGRALLTFLEQAAKRMGYRELRLETRRVNPRAVAFYLNNGYRTISNYGPYAGRDEALCFAKVL
ncbi:GNAT family N-acetyltransferase [Pantoea sp. C2G6]|uniref:GNAT family N-acetyltransferase n=1 Tax=Pantoea sp. C2G6 TaxID=3243084 RepID=UPI003ED8633B